MEKPPSARMTTGALTWMFLPSASMQYMPATLPSAMMRASPVVLRRMSTPSSSALELIAGTKPVFPRPPSNQWKPMKSELTPISPYSLTFSNETPCSWSQSMLPPDARSMSR